MFGIVCFCLTAPFSKEGEEENDEEDKEREKNREGKVRSGGGGSGRERGRLLPFEKLEPFDIAHDGK